jgi:hypothetical protein
MMLLQAFQHMVQHFEVYLVGLGVDQLVIDVDDDIGNVLEYTLQ